MSRISDRINEATGYANGKKFASVQEVREYFTPDAQLSMFGDEAVTDEYQLDDWANWVIFNASHMETGKNRKINVIWDSMGRCAQGVTSIAEQITNEIGWAGQLTGESDEDFVQRVQAHIQQEFYRRANDATGAHGVSFAVHICDTETP